MSHVNTCTSVTATPRPQSSQICSRNSSRISAYDDGSSSDRITLPFLFSLALINVEASRRHSGIAALLALSQVLIHLSADVADVHVLQAFGAVVRIDSLE